MKTNIYILLIFLLSISFCNAQGHTEFVEKEFNQISTVSEENREMVTLDDNMLNVEIENEVLLIDGYKLKEDIARRRASDIRIYLNRIRNVRNIKLLFPKINMAKTA